MTVGARTVDVHSATRKTKPSFVLATPVIASVLVVLLLVPFVVLIVRAVIGAWDAAADQAAIELRVRAVGGSHSPLVGPYSRFGWSHPGPLLFYLLAPMYRAFGAQGTGLLAGASVVNALAILPSVWACWRRARIAGLVCCALVLAALLHGLGGSVLDDPWNPYIIVLPMFTLAILTWSIACGDHWLLPLACAVVPFSFSRMWGLPCRARRCWLLRSPQFSPMRAGIA